MAEKEKQEKKKPKVDVEALKAAGKAKKAKAAADAQQETAADEGPALPAPPARLLVKYRDEIVPALSQSLGYKNRMAVPKLEKIVISMGVGKYAVEGGEGRAKIEKIEKELATIAGQKPVRCRAKKSVANFKVREGMETGLKVTLRGVRMYEFLDRLISLAFPRVKDFRGVNPNAFDKDGNYNFGFTEQTVFPEIDGAAVTIQQGMNITVVTSAKKIEDGRALLQQFGFPFRTEEKDGKGK